MEQLKNIGRELAMGSQGTSREYLDLIKTIGEAKSKAEEERIVTEEIEVLKKKIAEPDVPRRRMKEYIIRLVYVEMLGHDASFGYIQAVKMTHDDNLLLKKTGYLAVTLFLNEDHDLIILIINTIQKDLRSDNFLVCSAALSAVCRLINEETIPAVLPQVVDLLGHQKELVRKKAVMALHRFHQRSPSTVAHLVPNFRKILCDNDPSVMTASLCALFDLISGDVDSYRNLTSSFVSILKQVIEHRLPKSYNYHNTPAPFIQIKLLKILALLGAGDKKASENMYSVLSDVLKKSETNGNIGNALIYECICTITSIHPYPKLLEMAAEHTSRFLKNESHNLKYVGIDALSRIIKINPDFAEEHQLAVIDCLEDPDDTLKRQTLELLYKMTKSSNVEVIVDRMISYMKSLTDAHNKTEIASRCIELAERFAPSNQWFIQTMNQVFEHAGDLVPTKVAHDLMRLIAEGAGEEDEDADSQLRSSAVESYLQILGEPKLPSILLQVICWVLGEYGTADGTHSASYIIGRLYDVVEAHPGDDLVKGYAITAITKVCSFEIASGRKIKLMPECQAFINELAASHSTDLQQRAYEIQALLGCDAKTISAVLPMDASCEDIEINKNLPFLDNYVQSMLSKGAKPYIPPSERGGPISWASQHDESIAANHSLRFDPYEKPQLPMPSLPSVSSHESDDYTAAKTTYLNNQSTPNLDTISSDVARLRLDGVQKKWGRPTYVSSSSVAHTEADKSGNGSKSDGDRSAEPPAIPESKHTARSKEPEISLEKKKLAASLFGDASKAAGKMTTKNPKPASGAKNTPPKSGLAAPVEKNHVTLPPPPDLLDLNEEVPAVPNARDPMQDLDGLLDLTTSAASSNSVQVNTKQTGIDIFSLYETSTLEHAASLGKNDITVDLMSGFIPGERIESRPSRAAPLANTAAKKGHSVETSMLKDAQSRQVGVNPTSPNPDLFKDLMK